MKKKILVILPAYNAAITLARTVGKIPKSLDAKLLLVDDASSDNTLEVARNLGIETIAHQRNLGYGGNQKTCYQEALRHKADIVVMLHPDDQYDPRMIEGLILPIRLGICDMMLGNRIRSRKETLDGGMPMVKYLANRILTIIENVVLGQNLGELHSGYRAYSRDVLKTVNFISFSDGFVFDSEFMAAAALHGFKIGDVPVPTIYRDDSSQISLRESARYALQTISVLAKFLLQKGRFASFAIFQKLPLEQIDNDTI